MELLLVALFGFVLFVAGHKGLIIYARTFFMTLLQLCLLICCLRCLKGQGPCPLLCA